MKISLEKRIGSFVAWCLIIVISISLCSIVIGGAIIIVDKTLEYVQGALND